jgi:hypothetical protein
MNWCLATQFLTEVGTAVLVKKAKNKLRYLFPLLVLFNIISSDYLLEGVVLRNGVVGEMTTLHRQARSRWTKGEGKLKLREEQHVRTDTASQCNLP